MASTTSQLFRWTRISNVQVYYLYVGSMPGAKDIVDTGEAKDSFVDWLLRDGIEGEALDVSVGVIDPLRRLDIVAGKKAAPAGLRAQWRVIRDRRVGFTTERAHRTAAHSAR